MSWYALLALATCLLATLAGIIAWRSRSLAFPVGLLLIYYFTLLGGWVIVAENRGLDVSSLGWGYEYLYERLFPIRLDSDYWSALLLYSAFLITLSCVLLLRVQPLRPSGTSPLALRMSHGRLLLACGGCAVLTLLLARAQITEALASGASAYVLTRTAENDPQFSIGAILSRAALIPTALGVSTLCSGNRARYAVSDCVKKWHVAGYFCVLSGMYALTATLGNKNELLTSAITGFLFYLANARRPRYAAIVALGVVILIAVGAVEVLRSAPLALIGQALDGDNLSLLFTAPFVSNEVFGAHFSMYGALHQHLPLTWGTSIEVFVLSVVPRLVWPDRPADIYSYYAEGVSATEGQGYTIHHATGWYLNFGVAGLLLGAALLGIVWSALHNRLAHDRSERVVGRVFTVVAPWTFVAGLPTLMRSGPEGYKGLIINAFIVPTLLIAWSTARFVWTPADATPHLPANASTSPSTPLGATS